MAKARQCDRCKNFYIQPSTEDSNERPLNSIHVYEKSWANDISEDINTHSFTMDLCPQCIEELKIFMHCEEEEAEE